MRATVSLIAREAGVSTATVDRVLNGRPGVSARTRALVERVAGELGYFGAPSAKPVRLDVILPGGPNDFMTDLSHMLHSAAAARAGVSLRLHAIDQFDHVSLCQRLRDLQGETDAVGLVALDHPAVRAEVSALTASGVRTATLVSDISGTRRMGYIGIDNRAGGRLAGLLMGRFLPPGREARIAVFIGSPDYRCHEEREMGFRSIIGDEFPQIRISHMAELGDDRDRAYDATAQLLKQGQLDGIFNIGSGKLGIARALKDAGRSGSVVFIAHDLTESAKPFLLDGTIDALIDQNAQVLARELVKQLVSAVHGASEPIYLPRVQVILRENIPATSLG